MRRAFLGLPLPEDIISLLTVQQFLLPLPRKVSPQDFHITLVFLGEVRDDVLEAAHEGFQSLKSAPFSLALQGIGHFGGEKPRAVWAGVSASHALNRLQAKAERIAQMAGCPIEARKFVPHVTLGRFRPPHLAEAMRLERAIVEQSGFASRDWTVTELVLWESFLGRDATRYDVLARYPLSP